MSGVQVPGRNRTTRNHPRPHRLPRLQRRLGASAATHQPPAHEPLSGHPRPSLRPAHRPSYAAHSVGILEASASARRSSPPSARPPALAPSSLLGPPMTRAPQQTQTPNPKAAASDGEAKEQGEHGPLVS